MEPRTIDDAIALRDKILSDYTSKANRITSTTIPSQGTKPDYTEDKGYASIDFYVDVDKQKELIEEIKELYNKERNSIADSGLYPGIDICDYEERDESNQFVKDPNIKVIRFTLGLHEEDYQEIAHPLSQTEDDEMRNQTSARNLTKEDDYEVETRREAIKPGMSSIRHY